MAHVYRFPIPTRRYVREEPWPAGRPLHLRLQLITGAAMLGVVLLLVSFGPIVEQWSPTDTDTSRVLQAPSLAHPLGTDMFGRDGLSRLLTGGRASLLAGLLAVVVAAASGTVLGIAAGYKGGMLDAVVASLADALLAFPGLLLALVLTWLFGRGVEKAALGVAVAAAPSYVRIARASVRRLRRAPFVRAAHAVGAKEARILLRHILPNVVGPLLTLAVLDLGWAILHVSALSFLGVGARPPQAEWGAMLSEARLYMRQAPWLGLAPGLAVAWTVFAANLLGDAVQERLDPLRVRRR